MPTLRSQLQTLASDLNDSDGKSWSETDYIEYLNAGICLAASLNPKRFARPVDVKLQPGAQQPTGCDFLTAIVGVVSSTGAVTQISKRAVDSAAAAAFSRVPVPATGYFPSSAQISTDDRESFYVDPPVPDGANITVRVQCASPISFRLSDADKAMDTWACSQYEIAREWAMYRALSSERESVNGANSANAHRQTFFTLINVVLASETTQGDPMQSTPKKVSQ